MNSRRSFRKTALALSALLTGCFLDGNVAGTSSGVDNPQVQIDVAFTDSVGVPQSATGSLSIYLADQNPAVNPDPIATLAVNGDSSIRLSLSSFTLGKTLDSAQAYNLLLINDDSTGSLLLQLSYDPVTKKFSKGDSLGVSEVQMRKFPLVNYQSTLSSASDSGLERIFIPGTPFQAVVVDSGFTFSQIPAGTFPVRLITNGGVELPLPDSLDTRHPKPQQVDSNAPPIDRPPPAMPPPALQQVSAGSDTTVFLGDPTRLSGQVTGVSTGDPRLALLWRQVNPDPDGIAVIANPTKLRTPVSFPKPGAYSFVLSAAFGSSAPLADTVLIAVQAGEQPIPPAGFIEPQAGDTLPFGKPFQVVWNGDKADTLSLQFNLNGDSVWNAIATITARPGPNTFSWAPGGSGFSSCRLRLVNASDTLISASFTLADHPPGGGGPPPPPPPN